MLKVDNFCKIRNYEKVTDVNCPSFSGIVAGECKGDLWVDNIDTPHIAIANSYAVGRCFAFFGSIMNDNEYVKLKKYIKKEIFDFLKQKEISYFEFSIESEQLKPYILKIFEDKMIQSEREYSYRRAERISSNYSLPDGFTMHKVDSDFWKKVLKGDLDNANLLTNRILESWETFDDFLNKSLAFCITYFKRIVSVIVGTARYKNVIPIDIETDDKFKHKGLGYYLTTEFVNECTNRDLITQWDCVESNSISKKLAEKAEFKFFKESEVYWFDL